MTDIHDSLAPKPSDRYHNPYVTERFVLYQAALRQCVAAQVDAIAILGDLANDGDPTSLMQVVRPATDLGRPVWVIPGNHDCLVQDSHLAAAVEAIGRGQVSIPPTSGFAWHAPVHVAGLCLRAAPAGLETLSFEVEPWAESVVVCLSHYPVVSTRERITAAGFAYAGDLRDEFQIPERIAARRAPTIVVHGHLHVRDAVISGPILQLACAALVEPPHEITLLEIDCQPARVRVRRSHTAVTNHDSAKTPVLIPAATEWTWDAQTWVQTAPEYDMPAARGD